MIEDSIYTLLAAVGTVSPLITRQTQQKPYMVYKILSNTPTLQKDSSSRLDVMRLQVSVVSTTAKATGTLYEALRTALDRYANGSIQHIVYDNHYDDFDETSESYIRIVDFMLRIKR